MAPHITQHWNGSEFETEYALGYGVTRNLTMMAEMPWHIENGSYNFGGFNVKSKYRFWLKTKPGISYQGSFISKLVVPADNDLPTVLNIAITTGQEDLKLYWFATAGYAVKLTKNSLKKAGNHLLYNVSIGFRPFKVNYYKPDIVFFLETSGNTFSGGSNLAMAPTFFFTYRNFAFRGGVQFGVWDDGYVSKPATNYKFIFELHI